jgi:hypothetical protein
MQMETRRIMGEVEAFLAEQSHLQIPPEKSGVRKTSDRAQFLRNDVCTTVRSDE